MEDGVRALLVRVLEEREIDQPGAVLQRDEDDPLPRRDRRSLGGGADSGDQHLLARVQCGQVCGVGRAELPQQPVMVVHEVVGDVDGQHLQLGVEGLAAGHLRQPARRGRDQLAADRELSFPGAPAALVAVELGCLEQEVAAGQGAAQRVQGADPDEALDGGERGAGPLPQVLERGVRAGGGQPGRFVLADALHSGHGQSHPPPLPGFHDPVRGVGGVDVDREDRHSVAAGIGDQDAGVPHTGVVLQDPGVQGGGVVRLQPRRLHGGHGERDRVGAAEAVCPEFLDDRPDFVDDLGGVAGARGSRPAGTRSRRRGGGQGWRGRGGRRRPPRGRSPSSGRGSR